MEQLSCGDNFVSSLNTMQDMWALMKIMLNQAHFQLLPLRLGFVFGNPEVLLWVCIGYIGRLSKCTTEVLHSGGAKPYLIYR